MAIRKAVEMRLTLAEAQRFMAELARGASHIASCLNPESVRQAILDVSADFVRVHGNPAVKRFLYELALRLDERDKLEAGNLARQLAEHGCLPALADSTPTASSRRRAEKSARPSAENDDLATVRSSRPKAALELAA
jgi:hypothetical protein